MWCKFIGPERARFSIEYSIACALIYGQITLDEFTEAKIQDPRVQDMMGKINMSVDKELEKLGFIGTAPVKIKILKNNGEVILLENDLARGNPEKPFTQAEFFDKFKACVKDKMPLDKADTLLDQLIHLEQIKSVTSITELISDLN